MNQTVMWHITAATISVGVAALVVTAGSALALPSLAYLALVVVGAGAAALGVYVADMEWTMYFGIWPPWVLALVLDPTPTLAGGLLAGAVGGLVAVPLLLKVGNAIGSLAS